MMKMFNWVRSNEKGTADGIGMFSTFLMLSVVLCIVLYVAVPLGMAAMNSVDLSTALLKLSEEGYVAYGAPSGDWTTLGDLYTEDVYPQADSTWDIGAVGNEYDEGFFDTVWVGNESVVRSATYVVAASDAPAHVIAQADYVCDGTADDVQIQAAIDALPVPTVIYTNMIEGGGKVLLSGGQFNISTPIEIDRPSMTLEGMGRAQTSLKLINNADCDVIQYDSTAWAEGLYQVHLKNFQIDGDRDNNAAGSGIVFNGARASSFKNISILRMAEYGFYQDSDVKAVDYVTFDYCLAVSCALGGWYMEGSAHYSQVHLDNCYVLLVDAGEPGFYFSNAGSLFMNGCTYDGGAPGIGSPIFLDHCENVRIEGAMIYGVEASESAITIQNTVAGAVRGYHIEGCEIQSTAVPNTVCAFYIYGLNISDVQILGNRVSGNISSAVEIGTFGTGRTMNDFIIANNIFDIAAAAWLGISANVTVTNLIAYAGHSDIFMDVLAVSATHVRANEDLSAGIPITFTIDAQPDVPRTLSGHFDSHAQITAYTIAIVGVDAKGNTVTETLTEADGWDWETNNAFATVTSITMSARTGTGAGDTMDIGITDVLGLSNVIYANADVYKIKKNNANGTVAGAQIDTDYDTYDMAVIGLAATDDFIIWFRSDLNIFV